MFGPLHMSFHMLQCIYVLYDPLLHVSKECIEWKKLKLNKVSDNYQLSVSLAFMAYEELNRLFIHQYFYTLNNEKVEIN